NAAGIGIRTVQILRRPGCDADRPGSAALPRGGFGVRHGAHPRHDSRGDRDVDSELALELAVGVEHLNPAVAAVGYVDVPLGVGGDAVRQIEFARLAAAVAPLLHPAAV